MISKKEQSIITSLIQKQPMLTSATVVLSGGQDSVTCLALAAQKHQKVRAITFDYSQLHHNEIACAKKAALFFGATHTMVDLARAFDWVPDYSKEVFRGRPSTWVPGRNMIFLSIATSFAVMHGDAFVYTGVNMIDNSGYPDCSTDFAIAMNRAANLALDEEVLIVTPLASLSKAGIWQLGQQLGCMEYVIKHTLTCYHGGTKMNEWGMGCGACAACQLRMKGFYQALV